MLLELVLRFESHVGQALEFTFKNKKSKESTAESASSVGRRNSMRVETTEEWDTLFSR